MCACGDCAGREKGADLEYGKEKGEAVPGIRQQHEPDTDGISMPHRRVVGTSELKGYELLFRGVRRGAVATVEPKEGGTVPVLLWKIRQADEEALDRYEGYPRLYGKQILQVELEGKEVSAMGYIMTPGHELGIPSDGYVDVIWEGYEQCGLDTKPLEDAINKAYDMTFQQEQGVAKPGYQGSCEFGGMKPME